LGDRWGQSHGDPLKIGMGWGQKSCATMYSKKQAEAILKVWPNAVIVDIQDTFEEVIDLVLE
jgi:hypothetical protein